MTTEELLELLDQVQKMKCESAVLEIKSAETGCPKRLYDTLSAFSNQDEGGVLLFGVKEEDDFKEVGVYDVQDLQKKINEQALQMEPVVRPLLTAVEKDGRCFAAAGVPVIRMSIRLQCRSLWWAAITTRPSTILARTAPPPASMWSLPKRQCLFGMSFQFKNVALS